VAFDAGTIETTLDIDRTPFRKGLTEARKEAEAFEKRPIKLKVEVDKSFTRQIQREINAAQGTTGRGIKIPIRIDESQLDGFRKQLDRIGNNSETTMKRTGNRMARALLNPMVLQLGLIPGIAAAAGAAGALALGVLPLAIGGIGIAALKSNEQIKSAYSTLWESIKDDAEEIAEPLIGTFTLVASRIGQSWRTLQPDLAALFADSAPLITTFVDGVLGAAEQAVPRFRTAVQTSGPAMRGFANFIEDMGVGVGDFAIEISKSSVQVGRSADLFGDLIAGLLRDLGTLIAQFAGFWATVGPQWNATFGQMMDTLLSFTQGGLRGLGEGLGVTLGIVQLFLNILGPFAEAFGQLGGNLLGVITSWKLMAGAIGLVVKAWGLLKPSEWMGKMAGVVGHLNNASASFGGFITRVTGSSDAGNRFASVTTKMWAGISKAASTVPLLGTALLLGKGIIDSYWPAADQLAQKIQQGGAAAEEARGQMYSVADGYNRGSLMAQTFAASAEEVRAEIARQREGMTELERAQADAAKAQRDYDYAVQQHGVNSKQAKSAAVDLAGATDDVEAAQGRAAEATKDHNDKIIEQTNLMLGAVGARLNYQSALLQLEDAQRNLADAVAEHGAGSLQARQADIAYQQQLLQTVNALGARVTAENASKGETEASRLATAAMHQEIARLAVEAGENLPPALAEMAAGLTDDELAAMGVTREIDNTGNAIYRLPPGKSLSFPNDAPTAQAQVNNLANAINAVPPSKWTNFYLNYVTTGTPPANPDFGGGLGLFGGAPGRAQGGPVQQGGAYWVGDDPQRLPELFFPDQDGFVLNGRDSAKFANSVANPDTRTNPLQLGGDGATQPDYSILATALAEAIAAAFIGARFEIDGDQWARVVNTANRRNGSR
jgi:hypothetical protein